MLSATRRDNRATADKTSWKVSTSSSAMGVPEMPEPVNHSVSIVSCILASKCAIKRKEILTQMILIKLVRTMKLKRASSLVSISRKFSLKFFKTDICNLSQYSSILSMRVSLCFTSNSRAFTHRSKLSFKKCILIWRSFLPHQNDLTTQITCDEAVSKFQFRSGPITNSPREAAKGGEGVIPPAKRAH